MILVTGGAGYVGCILTQKLLERGYAVRIFDKLYFGEKPLKKIKDRIELVQGDIRKPPAEIFAKIEAVIHLAGLSNDPTAEFNPEANRDINTKATLIMAVAAKKYGVKRFIFGSSCSIYDRGLTADDNIQHEKSHVKPRAAYAVSKYEAEKGLLKLKDKSFCPTILRKGTIYGFSPRMRYDLVVNSMLKDAMSKREINVFCGGEQWRPLVDITDVARAYITLLEAPEEKVKGEIFNISYKNFRILELAHWIEKALSDKFKVKINVDYSKRNDRSYRVSTKKIKQILNFEASVSVEESTENMYQMIIKSNYTDYINPRYYNITWMTLLTEIEYTLKKIGRIF